MKTHLMLFSAVFILFGFGCTKQIAPPVPIPNQTYVDPQSEVTLQGSIHVSDQLPGDSLHIDSIDVSAPAWLVIYTSVQQHPGMILTKQQVPAGISTDLTVSLPDSTISGDSFFLLLHEDDGNDTFDFPSSDLPSSETKATFISISTP